MDLRTTGVIDQKGHGNDINDKAQRQGFGLIEQVKIFQIDQQGVYQKGQQGEVNRGRDHGDLLAPAGHDGHAEQDHEPQGDDHLFFGLE